LAWLSEGNMHVHFYYPLKFGGAQERPPKRRREVMGCWRLRVRMNLNRDIIKACYCPERCDLVASPEGYHRKVEMVGEGVSRCVRRLRWGFLTGACKKVGERQGGNGGQGSQAQVTRPEGASQGKED